METKKTKGGRRAKQRGGWLERGSSHNVCPHTTVFINKVRLFQPVSVVETMSPNF